MIEMIKEKLKIVIINIIGWSAVAIIIFTPILGSWALIREYDKETFCFHTDNGYKEALKEFCIITGYVIGILFNVFITVLLSSYIYKYVI